MMTRRYATVLFVLWTADRHQLFCWS